MFIAAFFLIAKTWRQQRYPFVDERINCGTYTMECYSVPKKKKKLSSHHEGTLNAYKKTSLISYILYDSNRMIFGERQNYGEVKDQ